MTTAMVITFDGEVYRFSIPRLICNQGARFYLKQI